MLVQPAQSLTDLLLGLATLALGLHLRTLPGVNRHWITAFWWFAIAALAGAIHHGFIVSSPHAAEISWTVISVVVVIAVSYLLAATVAEVLGPGHQRAFWLLRSVGLTAYLTLAVTGHAGVGAILACESLTMLSILVLWGWAARRHHPMARGAMIAIAASGAAAGVKELSPSLLLGFNPTAAYHLAQLIGMVLFYRAVAASSTRRAAGTAPPQSIGQPVPTR
ncbi:MAG TPA: hypothetical protein VGM91_02765 [Conexibacter sp.]